MTIKYVHTNIVARDWKKLIYFYIEVMGCVAIPPERKLKGEWIEKATDIKNVEIEGIHLQLPGWSESGPTLEVFQYNKFSEGDKLKINSPGFAHLAFAVDNVELKVKEIIHHGGTPVGDLTIRIIENVGKLIFQYVKDPEGNILEIQKWEITG